MKDKLCDVDGEVDGDWSTMLRNDVERLREMQLSIAASSSVFPGFRFSPTDDELISYYLKKKLQGSDKCVDIIPEVDFCRHEPWDLPGLSIIRSDNEWFFFSARGKKYPNGSQSKRATESGYWKATGKERNVKSGTATIGTKRTLVFHMGRAPKGERTEWIMHEYCMSDTTQESLVVCRLRRNGDFRLTESSRGSCNNRNSSTPDNGDNGDSGMNEYENNQVDGFDKRHAKNSYSKESTSSYRSSSVRQFDSESDSDRQQFHDSPHGSSTPYKAGENEDDCFADIINDDIINLDESATQSLTFRGALTGDLLSTKCMQKLPHESISSQGTAVRRIKLRRQKVQTHDRQNQPCDDKSSGCVVSKTAGNAETVRWCHPSHLIMVLLLLLMILFVAWNGDYLNSKRNLGVSTEVMKRQLKYWLHKAADNV